MALDLWFREDVLRILASTHETMRSALAVASGDDQEYDVQRLAFTDGYEQGFTDALRALSLSFGLAVADGPAGSQERIPVPGTLVQAPLEELDAKPAGSWAVSQDSWDRG